MLTGMGMQKKSKHSAYQVGLTKQTKKMSETNPHAALAVALQKAQAEFPTMGKTKQVGVGSLVIAICLWSKCFLW